MTDNLIIPPHSTEAEQAVIGALINWPDSYDQIHWLSATRFYRNDHKIIFSVIAELISKASPVDIITVAEALDGLGKLEEVGGIAYLGALAQNTPSSANVKIYAEKVQERGMARDMIAAIHQISAELHAPGNISEKLDHAQSLVMAISEQAQTLEPVFVGDMLLSRLERIEAIQDGLIKPVGTGFYDLDRMLGGGVEPGALIIIASRPSMGKTALAIQLTRHIQQPTAAALVFTCEMSNGQIVDRLISAQAKISSDKLRTGQIDSDGWDKISAVASTLKNLNMLIDDKTFTCNGIRSKSRTIKRKYGLSCVVVDYMQLLTAKGDNREQQVSDISRSLKALAKELEIPVFALSQLSRKVEERGDRRPIMSDLRESGAIEQDADVIMFIYRDEYYHEDSQYAGTAEINIAKNRNGKTGRVLLHFDREHTSFDNHSGEIVQITQPVRKRGFQYD